MKTEALESTQRRWLRSILEKVLRRGVRKEYLDALDENPGPTLQLAVQSAAAVTAGYGMQAVAAFNKFAFLVERPGDLLFCRIHIAARPLHGARSNPERVDGGARFRK